MTLSSEKLLDQVQQEFQDIIERAKAIEALPEELQLHRESPDRWHAVECIEHINLTLDVYLPNMQQAICKAKHRNWLAKPTFKSGFFGNKMTEGTRPGADGQIGFRMKTFKKTTPETITENTRAVFDKFYAQHEAMLEAIEEARSINLEKARVVSLIGPLLKFRLGDAFRFMAAHDSRHVLQAEKAIADRKPEAV